MFPQALPLLPALILLSASLRSASADPDVVASSVETESICIAFLCVLCLVFDGMIDVQSGDADFGENRQVGLLRRLGGACSSLAPVAALVDSKIAHTRAKE